MVLIRVGSGVRFSLSVRVRNDFQARARVEQQTSVRIRARVSHRARVTCRVVLWRVRCKVILQAPLGSGLELWSRLG